jgi:hypothetical protein
MADDIEVPLDQVDDLRHIARRLTWYQRYFRKEAEECGKKFNVVFTTNNRRLGAAFLNWADAFEHYRAEAAVNQSDFTVFAGGLMLRELLRENPATATEVRKVTECIPADPLAAICESWPEGFLYTFCCLTLVQAILKSDFNTDAQLSPQMGELRFWQSFRENVQEDVGRAVPFFDVFLRREPNWVSSEYFLSRPASRRGEDHLTTALTRFEDR